MKMKTDDNEEPKKTGLKMAGDEVEELQKKKGLSDIDSWDFSVEEDDHYVTSAKSKLQREAKESHEITPSEVVLRIFHVLVYLAIVVEIVTLSFMCMQENYHILYNLTDCKVVFIVVALVLLLDSILVNLFFENHFTLIIIALILPFLYPAFRGSIVSNKNGIGTIASFIYFLSICFTAGCVWTAYVNYGNVLTMEDRIKQEKVVNCMELQMENGESLREFLKDEMDNIEISFINDKQGESVCVKGNGTVYLKDDGFASRMTKDVPTTLIFQIADGRVLKLTAVTLREDELTETGVKNYWKWVTTY